MADRDHTKVSALTARSGRDLALVAALERIRAIGDRVSAPQSMEGLSPVDTVDTPDLHVTAVRRLPPAAGRFSLPRAR